MDAIQTKITHDTLRANGYVPHRLSGAAYLYEKDKTIIQIIPFINIINLRKESESGGYPTLVKSNIKYWEELQEYVSE